MARERLYQYVGFVLALHIGAHATHTFTHLTIPITLPTPLTVFTIFVVFIAPVGGFLLLLRGYRIFGGIIFVVSMAISLALGGTFHFVLQNPDHISSVPNGVLGFTFKTTAVAVALIDLAGSILGGLVIWPHTSNLQNPLRQSGRISGLPSSGFRPLTWFTYWFSKRMFGEVPEPVTIMAHNNQILWGTSAFEMALDRAGHVDERLKELAVLKAATVIGCDFCVDIGTSEAQDLGIPNEQLAELHRFEESDAFNELERLVLQYAVAVSTTPTDVPDGLYDELSSNFDEAEMVELTATIAFENYRGRFNHAFEIKSQGFSEGGLCPRMEEQPTIQE